MNLTTPIVLLETANGDGKNLLAWGMEESCSFRLAVDFYRLAAFIEKTSKWKFGAISYELNREFEKLPEKSSDFIGFPVVCFFIPQVVAEKIDGLWQVVYGKASDAEIDAVLHAFSSRSNPKTSLIPKVSKSEYTQQFELLQKHIHRGDVYELNYCIEFANHAEIHPPTVYSRLKERTKAPFSAFFKWENSVLMCGSPERYLRKIGNKVISQPIKGTAPRSADVDADAQIIARLKNDPKERAENIMITDLVRNDLSKSALPGSVKVEELCEIYSFQTVHQMISTITARYPENISFSKIIADTFPMGSMTGAPKVRAMELIDQVELGARGLYSGAVGYVDPAGDFDFNVVIRSLQYNTQTHYLSAMVGSAVTALANAETEYEECLLKADALFKALNDD
ncbi:MAG: anthranilate synthase component I family protein [Flavobacteriales bacterium]|nr:anthranilate synthase component I family protein [Flavobacteriales bacterium]